MTTTELLKQAASARLIELLEEAHDHPVSVPECKIRITRTAILREMVGRGILVGFSTRCPADANTPAAQSFQVL